MNSTATWGRSAVLFRPRMAMRWILNNDPNYGVVMIAMLCGLTAAMRSSVLHGLHPVPDLIGFHPLIDSIIAYGIGATPGIPMLITSLLIYGSVLGVFLVIIGTLGLLIPGKILGGSGGFRNVRAALSWSFVYYAWLLPLWLILALVEGEALRSTGFSFQPVLPWELSGIKAVVLVLDYLLRIYCLVILTFKLSEALRIALWRSVLTVALVSLPVLQFFAPWQRFGF